MCGLWQVRSQTCEMGSMIKWEGLLYVFLITLTDNMIRLSVSHKVCISGLLRQLDY